jgi:hypothetical protein
MGVPPPLVPGAVRTYPTALAATSPTTVKKHVSRILAKLKVDNRVQAAVYAVRTGLADPSSRDDGR